MNLGLNRMRNLRWKATFNYFYLPRFYWYVFMYSIQYTRAWYFLFISRMIHISVFLWVRHLYVTISSSLYLPICLLPCSASPLFSSLLSFPLLSNLLSSLFFKLIRRMECRTVLYCIVLYYIVLQSIVLYKIGSRLSAVISLLPLLPPSLQFLLFLFFYPHSNPHQINYIKLYST